MSKPTVEDAELDKEPAVEDAELEKEPAVEDAELEKAIQAICDPGRLRAAQDLVARAAPSLQRVLAAALADGGWFEAGHRQAVHEAVSEEQLARRLRAVDTLLAEETRLAMLVGVAVGFELSRELRAAGAQPGRRDAPGAAGQQNDDKEDRWRSRSAF